MQCACLMDDCNTDECVQLTDRELSICAVISASAQPVTFTQLKQTTNLHQEIVSRAVRRLAIHGLVRKVDGRYQGNCRCLPERPVP